MPPTGVVLEHAAVDRLLPLSRESGVSTFELARELVRLLDGPKRWWPRTRGGLRGAGAPGPGMEAARRVSRLTVRAEV